MNCVFYPIVVYITCYIVRNLLYTILSIPHCNTNMGIFYHIYIVLSIAKCHDFILCYSVKIAKIFNPFNLSSFNGNNINTISAPSY